jgi:hypothetical protein
MNPSWLTIITITKDDPGGLARTLESTARLRTAGARHVVVDGSREPGARANPHVAEAAGALVLQRPPRGVADAFNAGLAGCDAPWVWFLNGGDAAHELLDVEWLKTLLARTSADLVLGGVIYDVDGRLHVPPPLSRQWPVLDPWISHPAAILRRALFAVHGNFDTRFQIAMDYEWFLRVLLRDATVDVIGMALARFAPGGLSQQEASRALLVREHRAALRLHRGAMWKSALTPLRRIAWQAMPAALKSLKRR